MTTERTRTPVEAGIRKVVGKTGTKYEAKIRDPAGRARTQTFSKLSDARRWRTEAQVLKQTGRWQDPRLAKVSFAQWAAGPQWQQHLDSLRVSTQRIYGEAMVKAVAIIGEVPLPKLRRNDIAALRDSLLADGLSTGSVSQVIRVVRTSLFVAMDHELIDSNPAQRIKVEPADTPGDRSDRRALTPAEAGRLMEALPDRYRALVAVAATAGLRFGELVALRRHCVDLEAATLRVEATAKYEPGLGVVEGPPKTKAGVRVVPLAPAVLEILEAHLATFVDNDPEALVFTSTRGSQLDASRFRSRVWLPAQRAAGIDRPIVFHALRATAATWLFEVGVDPKTASRMLGHASANISADLYARGTQQARKLAADRVGSVFVEALESTKNVIPIRSNSSRGWAGGGQTTKEVESHTA